MMVEIPSDLKHKSYVSLLPKSTYRRLTFPFVIGAFYDDRISGLLGIDGREEAPVILHAEGAR